MKRALAVIALIVVAMLAPMGVAQADTPHCATFSEFQDVQVNWSRSHVRNHLGDNYDWVGVTETDFFKSCDGDHTAIIYYNNKGTGWYVVDAEWYTQ